MAMGMDISSWPMGKFKAKCVTKEEPGRGWLDVGWAGEGLSHDRITFFATEAVSLDDMCEAFAAMLRENGYEVKKDAHAPAGTADKQSCSLTDCRLRTTCSADRQSCSLTDCRARVICSADKKAGNSPGREET